MKKTLLALLLGLTLTITGCSNSDSGTESTKDDKLVIGTQTGTIQETTLKTLVGDSKNVEIVQLSSYSAIIQDMKAGRIDVMICENAVTPAMIEVTPDLVVNSFDCIHETEVSGNAIGVSKENAELLAKIDAAIVKLEEDGVLPELIEKFFSTENVEITKSIVAETNTNTDTIVVGTSGGYAPYEVVDVDGKLGGFDIELAEYIALELGVKIEWNDVSFEALVPGVQEGKFDFIIAGLTPTAERRESIDFSLDYYSAGETVENVLVSLKDNPVTYADLEAKLK